MSGSVVEFQLTYSAAVRALALPQDRVIQLQSPEKNNSAMYFSWASCKAPSLEISEQIKSPITWGSPSHILMIGWVTGGSVAHVTLRPGVTGLWSNKITGDVFIFNNNFHYDSPLPPLVTPNRSRRTESTSQ